MYVLFDLVIILEILLEICFKDIVVKIKNNICIRLFVLVLFINVKKRGLLIKMFISRWLVDLIIIFK